MKYISMKICHSGANDHVLGQFSNPEVQPSGILVVMMNLTSAHPKPCSLLFLLLIYRWLILLRL